jgi:uncharacterized sulfatase
VELVDVCPTLLDLCNVAPSGSHKPDGTSLRPLLDDPSAPWDEPAYTQVTRGNPNPPAQQRQGARRNEAFMGRTVRNERWRYTEWDDGKRGRELYDHEGDPTETKNLANDPRLAAVVEQMRKLLK